MGERRTAGWLPYLVLLIAVAAFGLGLAALLRGGGEEGFAGWQGEPRVGLVEIRGVILESDRVVDALDKLRRDERTKAVILRVDSPGGAVGPSQEIYEAVLRLRETKPVVASMGSVAASGGYYVASAASRIVANPGTLTGSIGVILQFMDLSQLLAWAKVRIDVVKTGAFKDAGAAWRPLTDSERDYFQHLADVVLERFITDVLRGRGERGPDEDSLRALADGRVFAGSEAVELRLVDELGGYAHAVSVAAGLGGIEGEPEIWRPRVRPPYWERLLEEGVDTHWAGVVGGWSPLWLLWRP